MRLTFQGVMHSEERNAACVCILVSQIKITLMSGNTAYIMNRSQYFHNFSVTWCGPGIRQYLAEDACKPYGTYQDCQHTSKKIS